MCAHVNQVHKGQDAPDSVRRILQNSCRHGCGHRFVASASEAVVSKHEHQMCPHRPERMDPVGHIDGYLPQAHNEDGVVSPAEKYAFFVDKFEEGCFWDGGVITRIPPQLIVWRNKQTEAMAKDELRFDETERILPRTARMWYSRMVFRNTEKGTNRLTAISKRMTLWDQGDFIQLQEQLDWYDEGRKAVPFKPRKTTKTLAQRSAAAQYQMLNRNYKKATAALKNNKLYSGNVQFIQDIMPDFHEVLQEITSDEELVPETTDKIYHKAVGNLNLGTGLACNGDRLDHEIQCNLEPSTDEAETRDKRSPHHYQSRLSLKLAAGVMQYGEMTDAVYSALDSCSLNVLERPDGRPRHTGGGHVQRKIGNAQLQLILADKLEAIMVKCGNLGFAVRGASDIIIHGLQMMRELNSDVGILTTDGKNAFPSLKRSETLRNLDLVLGEGTMFMKRMFYAYHSGKTKMYYRDPSTGILHHFWHKTGVIMGEQFALFWYCVSMFSSLQELHQEFPGALTPLPYVDDVPIAFSISTKVQKEDHPLLLDHFEDGETSMPLGRAVALRWAEISERNMGVKVLVHGECKTKILLQTLTQQQDANWGGIATTIEGLKIMGAPVGNFSFRHSFIKKILKGKHQEFYTNAEILDGLQWQQSLCSISGGAKRLTYLLRTVPRSVWTHRSEEPGSQSLLEMSYDIFATNLKSMYKMTAQELSSRVQEQLRFSSPMGSLGEEDVERIMDAAYVAGF